MAQEPQHPDDDRVARLLADARHTEPLPTDVADRLDRALVGLAAERRAAVQSPVAPVVDLASRRRRRLTTGLVAAAAVVAIGVGLPTLIEDDFEGGQPDQATSEESGNDAAERELSSEEAPAAGDAAPEGQSGDPQLPDAEAFSLLEISPDSFRRDARAARDQASYDTLARPEVCGDLPTDAERVVSVRYADREGYLVFGVPATDRQEVSLYLCPEGALARQVTISVR